MGKRDRVNQRMMTLESAFRVDLTMYLEEDSKRGSETVFRSSKVLPPAWPPGLISKKADALTALAEEIIAMHRQLGISSERTSASMYLDASSACYDLSDHHRPSPLESVRRLILQLQNTAKSNC